MVKLNLQFFGGRGASSGAGKGNAAQAQTQVRTFSQMSDADERTALAAQSFTKKQEKAISDYVDDKPVRGTLYSFSQNLNYKMERGLGLTKKEQGIVNELHGAMRQLGKDLQLTHFARVGMMDGIGSATGSPFLTSRSFESLTDQQLKSLEGKTFSLDRFVSASYNGFRNAPNGGRPFTDKAVEIEIHAPSTAMGLFTGDKGGGGRLGETVLDVAQNYRIKRVYYPGGNGRSGARQYRKIKFEVEIY